jgi:heme/copper-type cytochrome/quinol oxidase subunit 4
MTKTIITLTLIAMALVAYTSFIISRDLAVMEGAQTCEACIQTVYGMTVEQCKEGNNNKYCVCR